ncbi:MAG: hypothetical protein DRN30_06305 [Thermoplasmata archaeon]|nr:MAG: hypothetical protein DRN30_06305 [Thermoplasmata archaeon]
MKVIKEWWFKVRYPLIKAGLEALRLLVIALIPLALNYIKGDDIPIEIQGLIILVIRALDKYLHDFGKENKIDWMIRGITRF